MQKQIYLMVLFLACTTLINVSVVQGADMQKGRAALERGDYATAQAEWRPLAEAGEAVAQFQLGSLYMEGRIRSADPQEAATWFEKAAKQGYAPAQYNLGVMYYTGSGIKRDYTSALNWLIKAAEQGNASAQFNIGVMYAQGTGVRKDMDETIKWFRKAGELGHVQAQFSLGLLYNQGTNALPDSNQAAVWYQKAAEQGHAQAQYNLGVIYASTLQDFVKAHAWLSVAISNGITAGVENRDMLTSALSPDELTLAQKLAAEIRQKTTQQAKP